MYLCVKKSLIFFTTDKQKLNLFLFKWFAACDCNLEGTERPSCDPETGECICRIGVTGSLCDECAPGYDSAFPACEECHPCNALWSLHVTDVERAAQKMKTLLPRPGDDLQATDSILQQQMLEMHSKLDSLRNLTTFSPPKIENIRTVCVRIR